MQTKFAAANDKSVCQRKTLRDISMYAMQSLYFFNICYLEIARLLSNNRGTRNF